MKNYIAHYEEKNIAALTQNKEIPEFQAGDTVRVSVKVIDGNNTRLQAYEGVVIARENKGIASSFVVRKISHGEGVERKFMIYSPIVEKITVVKRGIVRRAKLYYLRKLRGKAARIQERITFNKPSAKKNVPKKEQQTTSQDVQAKMPAEKNDTKVEKKNIVEDKPKNNKTQSKEAAKK